MADKKLKKIQKYPSGSKLQRKARWWTSANLINVTAPGITWWTSAVTKLIGLITFLHDLCTVRVSKSFDFHIFTFNHLYEVFTLWYNTSRTWVTHWTLAGDTNRCMRLWNSLGSGNGLAQSSRRTTTATNNDLLSTRDRWIKLGWDFYQYKQILFQEIHLQMFGQETTKHDHMLVTGWCLMQNETWQLQPDAVITRCNVTWYFTQHCSDSDNALRPSDAYMRR